MAFPKILNRFKKKQNKNKSKEIKKQLRDKYLEYREQIPLDESAVMLEARNGKEIDGNVYYILRELLYNERYERLNLFVAAESEEKRNEIELKIRNMGASRDVEIICVGSDSYYNAMATSKYIVSDATLQNFFIKRDGQVYLNLWHGTPFKVMGRKVIHEPHAVGNVQKNFAIADYLLYPNEYMKNHMIEDYMLENISIGKALMAGYPRNSAFFDEEHRGNLLNRLGLEGKKVYVYMPTHRPSLMGETLEGILSRMDNQLESDEVLYAKIHPLASDQIDYSKYEKVKPFPKGYETYEFLNLADVLITDYSSVFYDFAVTGRKIVLYTYDEMEYLSSRGLYEPIESLPFPQEKSVEGVFRAIRRPKEYDDSEFIAKYCPYDGPNSAAKICALVFGGEVGDCKLEPIPDNDKGNVMVFISDLKPSKQTDAIMSYLDNTNKNNANYFVTFRRKDLADHASQLFKLPEGINYFGRAGNALGSDLVEHLDSVDDLNSCLDRHRCFGEMRIDEIVDLR